LSFHHGAVLQHGYTARDMVNQQLIMFANDRLLTERPPQRRTFSPRHLFHLPRFLSSFSPA